VKSKYFEAVTYLRKDFPVGLLCKAFGISRSGYYEYLNRPIRPVSERDIKDRTAIQAIYDESCGTYGAKHIAGTLKKNKNHIVNHKRVARLMKEMNIKSKIRKMKSKKEEKVRSAGYVYPNLLERNFDALFPNHKWVMDVTEITHGENKIYISALMDLFNRDPIGIVISRNPNKEMMEETIRKAMKARDLQDLSQVLIHTDQGNIYRSFRYNQLSRELGFTPSMSRKANCWDNAVIESFFSHLKTEFPHHYPIESLEQIELDLLKFINYFKEKRSQKRLGYLSPEAFLAAYLEIA